LNAALKKRAGREALVDRFIIRDTKDTASMFQRQKTLSHLLERRASRSRLVGLGVIKEEDAATTSMNQNFAAAQRKLQESKKRDKLNRFLDSRPTQESLRNKRILHDKHSPRLFGHSISEQKQKLGSFLLNRPSPEHLLEQKVISDIGHLPAVDENEEQKLQGNVATPALVQSLAGKVIKKVACGWGHTTAVDEDGHVLSFGLADNGRLGTGTTAGGDTGAAAPSSCVTSAQLLVFLNSLGRVSELSCGDAHTGAIVDHKLYMWGAGAWGRLGLGSQDDLRAPMRLCALSTDKIQHVACGAYHTLVVGRDHVYAFGWNKNARLGLGRHVNGFAMLEPREIPGLDSVTVTKAYAGHASSAAITDNGNLYTWGSGSKGILGHNAETDLNLPTEVAALKDINVIDMAFGSSHALALASDGAVYSWGSNSSHELGRDTCDASATFDGTPSLVDLAEVKEAATAIACGRSYTAIIAGGQLYTWGKGTKGVLGHGNEDDVPRPKLVEFFADKTVVGVACSMAHTAVVTSDGKVYTCGEKRHGKLGHD
jgi:alpha-tubulin suppressor-like RCC1 family protein